MFYSGWYSCKPPDQNCPTCAMTLLRWNGCEYDSTAGAWQEAVISSGDNRRLIIYMFSKLWDRPRLPLGAAAFWPYTSKPRYFCLFGKYLTGNRYIYNAWVSLGNSNIFCHANVLFGVPHNLFHFITWHFRDAFQFCHFGVHTTDLHTIYFLSDVT